MSNVRTVFLSSTFYDLRDVRSALGAALSERGFTVLANEVGTIPVDSRKHSYDTCLAAAAKCDCLIAIIDSRFGGKLSGEDISITQAEIRAAENARTRGRIYPFVRQSVWDAKEIYKQYREFPFKPTKIVEDEQVLDLIDW